MEYSADLTPEDIAEIIMIVRTRKMKLNEQGFVKAFPGITLESLRRMENGIGTSGIRFLYRLQEEGYVRVGITVEM